MLPVAIHPEHNFVPTALRELQPGLDSATYTQIEGMPDHLCAGSAGRRRGLIRRPIVDDDNIRIWYCISYRPNYAANRSLLIIRRDENE